MKSHNLMLPMMFKFSKPARKYLQGLVVISALFLLLTNKNSTEMAAQLRKMAPNDYGMGNSLVSHTFFLMKLHPNYYYYDCVVLIDQVLKYLTMEMNPPQNHIFK